MPFRFVFPTAVLLLTTLVALAFSLPLESGDLIPRAPRGPVISSNFPDPGLINVNGKWYAFATRTKGTTIHIQIASSTDFDNWSVVNNPDGSQKDALPKLPAWVNQTSWNTWAPSIAQISPTRFVMYFSATTATDTSGRFHCVGWAVADNIEGPYQGSDTAFICPLRYGGAIDPSAFQDNDGRRYVVYKDDGNAIGNGGPCGNTIAPIQPTWLVLQPLAADGVTKNGSPVRLLNHNGVVDDGIVEAPAITRTVDGKYFLFFSKGCFTTSAYTVSYATADRISGPYTRQPQPLFKTGDFGLTGPGGACVASDARHLIFHAFNGDPSRFLRSMHTALLKINGTTVTTE